jgi:Icc-related predicted phosphoesterase
MDFGRFDMPIPKDADVAVVAGDVQNDELLIRLGETLPTVYVAGNHDFYGREYHKRLEELRNLPSSQLYVLENDELVLGDVRFLGCTLWTDYNGGDERAMNYAFGRMNDHHKIHTWKGENSPFFTPKDALNLHKTSKNWLKERFSEPFSGKTVVLTHHCPSERSVAPKYAGQMMNHAYFSALDAEIEEWRPDLWIHGHMHANADYMIGETRVVLNPHGYPGENPKFNPNLIVEV